MKKKFDRLLNDADFMELFRGGRSAFLISLAGMGIGYLFILLVSRIFKEDTAQIYGQYVLFTLLVKLLAVGCKFGLDTLTMKMTSEFLGKGDEQSAHQFFKKSSRLMVVTSGTVLVVYYGTLSFWKPYIELDTLYLILVGIAVIFFSIRYLYAQFLRGYRKIVSFSLLTNFSVTFLNTISLLLFWAYYSLFLQKQITTDVLIGTFILSVLFTFIFSVFLKNRITVKSSKKRSVNLASKNGATYTSILKSSYPFSLTESMIFLSVWTDQLMLGFLGSASDVGILNVCMKYMMVTSLVLRAVNVITGPKFSEAYAKNDTTNLKKNVRQSSLIIFWISAPIFIFYAFFSTQLLGVFGNEFESGRIAFLVMTFGAFFNVLTGSSGTLMQMTNHQVLAQNIMIASVIVGVILNLILIPELGLLGAAVASTTSQIIRNLSLFYYAKKNLGISTVQIF